MVRFVPDDIDFNFVRYGKHALVSSIVLVICSIITMVFHGLEVGTDFTGGIVIDFSIHGENIDDGSVKSALLNAGLSGMSVQSFKGNNTKGEYMLTFRGDTGPDKHHSVDRVKAALNTLGEVTYNKLDYVGAQVGVEQIKEAVIAVCCALLCMFAYLCIRFRWQFAMGGVLALLHDIIITMGMISVTGLEFSLPAMAGILMIIGYSVNDSVVIYDRVRELMKSDIHKGVPFVVNAGINTTLSRTLLTSGTTLIAALPLIILCDGAVRNIGIIVFCGIVVGTYSSIFISTVPFVKSLEKELTKEREQHTQANG
ncbi:protein translocase subunit SecF [Anaplasma bovis]|uniref:protein translocase subunit SecF n=1 Tax=Anaplasma bovis TaxID=186733 RepID=UPI002FEFC2E5